MSTVQEEQDWIEAYLELCAVIRSKVPEIKHIDLWYDQLNYEAEEYPYPEECLFLEFTTVGIDTIGLNVQDMMTQIKFIYAFDTLSDTYDRSVNQAVALSFGKTMRKLHKTLQGLSGSNFSSLNRVGFGKELAPESCIAYGQTYATIIRDYSAMEETETVQLQNMKVKVNNGVPVPVPDTPLFDIYL